MVSPLDPEPTHSPPSQGLKGDPNGAKKALSEIGRGYNIGGRTMKRGSRDKQTTPFRRAGDFQHRPRGTVHQGWFLPTCWNRWGTDHDGWPRAPVGQRLCRATAGSRKYEEVHLKANATPLEPRIGIGRRFRVHKERRLHQALVTRLRRWHGAVRVSPVDLPLHLDGAGASPTTPQEPATAKRDTHLTRKGSGLHLRAHSYWSSPKRLPKRRGARELVSVAPHTPGAYWAAAARG
jgi:hypothetical protein